jgi:trigger factor
MGFTISEIGPCKKRAEFDLSSQEVLEGFDQVYGEICETISFPGFRKGKVPRALVAKKYGKDIIGEVKEKLISKTFYEMVDEEKLDIISQPNFDEKDKALAEGEPFAYNVSFEIRPEFELPEYKGIELKKEVREVTDASIEETQSNLLRSHAQLQDVEDGEIEDKDFPVLNLDVKDEDGEVLHHNHGFVCALEYGRLDLFSIDDLNGQFKGKKAGDKVDIEFEVPEDFSAKEELAGKKVTLAIEIEAVRKLVEPEFNEEFLNNLGFSSEEEYRNTLKEMLENEFERNSREGLKTQIYDFLNDKVETDLPEDTVKRHSEYLVNSRIMEMMRGGMPQKEAEAKKSEIEADAESEARREIKVGFALTKISDAEKVFVTEREISQRVVQLASQRGTSPEQLKEELEKNHELSALRGQIKEEKTIDLLIKKAKVTEEKVEGDKKED